MKKVLLATALLGLSSPALAGTVATDETGYVSIGYYDWVDSSSYLAGGYRMGSFMGHVEYNDAFHNTFKAELEYHFGDTNYYVTAGAVNYDFGEVIIADQIVSRGSESGAIVGAGNRSQTSNGTIVDVSARYNTAGDGWWSVGAGVDYPISSNTYFTTRYDWNSDSMSNEWSVGVTYAF